MLAAANATIKEQISFEQSIEDQYKARLKEIARHDSYLVAILVSEPDDIDKYWLIKQYDHHKISRQDYDKSRELLKEFTDYDFSTDEAGAESRMDSMMSAYKFLSLCYLKMDEQEFYKADWEVLKDIINACEYRTENSVAAESKALTELFFFGTTKTLTKGEREAFKIYRLWKKWHTKPWEVNGGIVYPEDINSTLHIEEIQAAAEAQERKKQESLARLRKGRGK